MISSACKKDTAPATNIQSTSNACSTIGTAQDTIVDSGTKYCIVATSGTNNTLAIELVNKTGAYASNLSVSFLQAKNGTNCFESNNVTALVGSQYKPYTFGTFPSWAIDTATICIAKVTINSTVYYLRDIKLNK